jgi:hypothetical protein
MDDRISICNRASPLGRVNCAAATAFLAALGLVRGVGAQDSPAVVPPSPVAAPESPNSTKALDRDPIPGDRVILVFLDGQRVEGEFVRSEPNFAVVKVANVESPFERSTLSQIIVIETPLVRFKRLRGAIRESDTERRTDLAEWAKDQGLYDEGLAEVQGVLKLDPGSADAIRLRGELESLIRLREAAKRNAPAAKPVEPDTAPASGKAAHPTRPQLGEFPLLTDEQVNTIKVYEVDLKNPPKITISRETIDKLLTRYADHPLIPTSREAKDGFRLLPPEKILETMFRVRARDLYSEVKVVDNPASMKKFREQVHSAWLVNNCATTRCHGGSAAGRLLLTNRRPNADQSVYTNFLIIDRFQTAEGRPLINWAEPERSVLLQMGLPRDDALTPHPEVKGWSPVFRSRDDRRFGQAVEWMKMMYRPRPEYGVEYPGKVKEGGDAAKVPEMPER